MRQLSIRNLCFALVLASCPIWLSTGSGSAAEPVTTLPAEKLEVLDTGRRECPGMGKFWTGPAVQNQAAAYQKLLDRQGPEAIAADLLAAYATPESSTKLEGLAVALLTDAGYKMVKSDWQDQALRNRLHRTKKEDPAKLTANVFAIHDAIAASKDPLARNLATELLLQVSSEGLSNLHNKSGNGNRKVSRMPAAINEKAAGYLDDPDPFIRAMAEWTLAINLGNDNDATRARTWPGKTPPAWLEKWMQIDSGKHLSLDYARQAMTLGMHRRSEDLLALARDVVRRAEARAQWAAARMNAQDTDALSQARNTMGQRLAQLASQVEQSPKQLTQTRQKWLSLREAVRQVVLKGPEINFDSVVFIERHSSGFHLQPGVHGKHHPDGGDIYVKKGLNPEDPARALIQGRLKNGVAQDMDLWWDGDKVVFSWPAENGPQKIFEVSLDGKNLRQITDGPFDDVDPAYMPDGSVVYGSTAAEAGIMCAGGLGGPSRNGSFGTWNSAHTNIYIVNPQGKVNRLSYCKDDDAYPQCLNDGRIVYMRWDYQERDVNEIFSLWVIRPDGTYADGFFKVHIPQGKTVQALRDARSVEGTDLLVATGSGHYTWAEGGLILCDPTQGINNPDALKNVTPMASPYPAGIGDLQPVAEGGVPYIGGYYSKPYALSEKSFFVSASYDQPNSCNFGAYYVDVWGNKELIHRAKLMETMCLMPVRPRLRPPVLPDMTDDSLNHAVVFVDDVYADLPGVEKGSVKYIRICQQMFWLRRRDANGCQWHPKSNAGYAFGYGGTGGPVRVVGTVPVEEDGSAHFKVPSDVDLYFQALDENFMAVQRMRTHVEFAPGEKRGCIGCHETKVDAVRVLPKSIALERNASQPTPPPFGDSTLINYETMIQPVFEAKCVKCHGDKDPKGKLNLTAKRGPHGFMQSYRSLYGLGPSDPTPMVFWGPDGPIKGRTPRNHDHPWWDKMLSGVIVRGGTRGIVTKPMQFGAVQCPLTLKLVKDPDHKKLLSRKEMELLMTWIDLQVPYFDTYMQNVKGKLTRVKVEPFPPFGDSRDHTILGPVRTASR